MPVIEDYFDRATENCNHNFDFGSFAGIFGIRDRLDHTFHIGERPIPDLDFIALLVLEFDFLLLARFAKVPLDYASEHRTDFTLGHWGGISLEASSHKVPNAAC